MACRQLSMSVMLLSALALTGCFNSESDYQLVVSETEELTKDLAAANRENDILNQALVGIQAEQEQLQMLLHTASTRQAQAASAGESGGGATGASSPPAENAATWPTGGYNWYPPSDSRAPASQPPAVAPAVPARAAASGKKIYKPKPGDVLTSIAARNHTTVEELVALNPYLARRRNYMIWETDKIILP